MKTYRGSRTHGVAVDVVQGLDVAHGEIVRPLAARRDLCDHSPTGFEWGYGGSGPAQLALALLADALGDDEAIGLYQAFKWEVVAALPFERWEISQQQIERWQQMHLATRMEERCIQ